MIPWTTKTFEQPLFMNAMSLLVRFWRIMFLSSRSAISKSRLVNGGIGLYAMNRSSMYQTCLVEFKSRQHAVHHIGCSIFFSSILSTSSAVNVRNYHELKDRNRNDCRLRYDMKYEYIICIPLIHQIAIPDNM